MITVAQCNILTKIGYPIMVNGTEYSNTNLPALNYQGNTYLPLKAIGDVLGVKVNWNDKLNRVDVGEIKTVTPKPNETLAPPQIISNYVSVIKINGEIYQLCCPIV